MTSNYKVSLEYDYFAKVKERDDVAAKSRTAEAALHRADQRVLVARQILEIREEHRERAERRFRNLHSEEMSLAQEVGELEDELFPNGEVFERSRRH